MEVKPPSVPWLCALCSCHRIAQFVDAFADEIGVRITMVNPAIHRAVHQRILKAMFGVLGMSKTFNKYVPPP